MNGSRAVPKATVLHVYCPGLDAMRDSYPASHQKCLGNMTLPVSITLSALCTPPPSCPLSQTGLQFGACCSRCLSAHALSTLYPPPSLVAPSLNIQDCPFVVRGPTYLKDRKKIPAVLTPSLAPLNIQDCPSMVRGPTYLKDRKKIPAVLTPPLPL